MAQTNVSIRMDEDLKKQFEQFCANIGMSMTTAFCVFAKTAVSRQEIPFIISAVPPNGDTRRAIQDARAGIGLSEGFRTVAELMEDLNADD